MYTPQRNQLLDEVWAAMLLPKAPVVQDFADAYTMGRLDAGEDVYHPPLTGNVEDYDAYLRGWNDEWAERNGRTLSR